MKTREWIGAIACAVLLTACGSNDYDSDIEALTKNLADVKAAQQDAADNLAALERIVQGLSGGGTGNGGYITSVVETAEGFTFTMNDGKTYTIHHGKDGADGKNGADGKDGTNGKNGTNGKDGADGKGDAYFAAPPVVNAEEGYVEFTLIDGTKIRMTYFESFKKQLQSLVYVPDYSDGKITVDGTTPFTITYKVKPAALSAVITKEMLSLIGEQVTTRSTTTAQLTINSVTDNTGAISLNVTPSGFDGSKSYAFALELKDDISDYLTVFTPIYVKTHPTGIAIAAPGVATGTGIIIVGRSQQLQAVFMPAYTTERSVTWSSSNTAVATVDANGVVTAVSDGTTTITLRSSDKTSLTATLALTISGGYVTIDRSAITQALAE